MQTFSKNQRTETVSECLIDYFAVHSLHHFCLHFRQEYLGMQTKYNALEQRSKDLVIQQSSAVSGASLALAGLGSRLDSLVDQLISSYNISEQELEVCQSYS